jgi:DNA-binding response OmpR family regulator
MRRTILLADDSTTIRRLVKQTFADENFRIVEVSNGDAAIKMLEEMRPSIVLTDIYMPGKNGYEVCAYIRNHPALSETPVILLVGAFDAFDEATARESGATANITKPFEPGALIDLVLSVLRRDEEEPEVAETAAIAIATAAPTAVQAAVPISGANIVPEPNEEDLLGLEVIFKDDPAPGTAQPGGITEEDIDRIADRVIQRLSSQVIESIAWDIVPDITEKIVREELKRIDES